ncbi:hypothetical protein SAMN05192561_103241 [Halopenitus malekzadehii]|uniref:Uncharacterized protein n=1 Tax=Halopenitus malekzadehii TaxID=1267564 RepID=A0A1H6IVG6_9EURY|nr:hypothetical protein [Halopenitus malekzadehii]SEH50548.1 hypothetical protein SAMN05192561_103241 [Halopenitus malekzadehii]
MKTSSETGVLSRLRRPEYTGDNRCTPCTILNLGIAIILAIVAGYAALTIELSPIAVGVVTLSVSLLAIYLRGYLIPGTPTITKRYFPDRVLAWFEKTPEPVGGEHVDPERMAGGDAGLETDNPEAVLLDIGVVIDDPANEDLILDPEFERAWGGTVRDHWREEQSAKRSLGTFVNAEPDAIEFDAHAGSFLAWADDAYLASWPSRAACVADTAAATELPAWDPDWDRRSLASRAEILGALRLFLERCPACGGAVVLSQDVVESCCRSRDVVTATCQSCDSRLFELDVDPSNLPEE